ncbi:hypothetical protein ACILFN_08130 [Capnocytophaga canimorsus]|uniref:hypothetical protein n=1 Tax=Capnocytophaga canimorsus TaxID=28188 RepID=UPI0037D28D14
MKNKQTKWLYKDNFEGLSGIILESRGGTKGTMGERNLNYKTLLEEALANFKINRDNEVQIFIASRGKKEKYPNLESRLLIVDGKDTFDFENMDINLFLPKLNKAIRESGQTGDEIGGNSTKRLFFYVKPSTKKDEDTIEKILDNTLKNFQFLYKGREDVLKLQNTLLQYLKETLPNYNWSKEYLPSKEIRDRIDIFGESKNDLPIIIELDPHRADSIAKKFVSRISLMKGKEILYVVFMYPGTEKMSLKEAEKYLRYCDDLASRLGNKFLSYNFVPSVTARQ